MPPLPPNRTHIPGACTYTGPAYHANDPPSDTLLPPCAWTNVDTDEFVPTLRVFIVTAQFFFVELL